jgi:hypothetical protein
MAYTYRVDFFIRILRLCLGAFFIVLGLCGIFWEMHESIFEISRYYRPIEIIFGIVEIFCGLLLILGFFVFRDSQPVYWGAFILIIAWIARIVLSRFFLAHRFTMSMSIAGFFQWLLGFTCELVIAAALFVIIRRHE